jgi:hypothetical protein
MSPHQSGDWQHLAEKASNEMDPSKLKELVSELNRVLREREETSLKQQHQGNQLKFVSGLCLAVGVSAIVSNIDQRRLAPSSIIEAGSILSF